MTPEEQRLHDIIARNAKAFERLKTQANGWRDRALKAEAALGEARRKPAPATDPTMDMYNKLFGDKQGRR